MNIELLENRNFLYKQGCMKELSVRRFGMLPTKKE